MVLAQCSAFVQPTKVVESEADWFQAQTQGDAGHSRSTARVSTAQHSSLTLQVTTHGQNPHSRNSLQGKQKSLKQFSYIEVTSTAHTA